MIAKSLYKTIATLMVAAGYSKIVALHAFYIALLQAGVFPGWACAWICILIPSTEIALGLLGVFTPLDRSQILSVAALVSLFAGFNILRIIRGDVHTCSCISTNLAWLNQILGESIVNAFIRCLLILAALCYVWKHVTFSSEARRETGV